MSSARAFQGQEEVDSDFLLMAMPLRAEDRRTRPPSRLQQCWGCTSSGEGESVYTTITVKFLAGVGLAVCLSPRFKPPSRFPGAGGLYLSYWGACSIGGSNVLSMAMPRGQEDSASLSITRSAGDALHQGRANLCTPPSLLNFWRVLVWLYVFLSRFRPRPRPSRLC